MLLQTISRGPRCRSKAKALLIACTLTRRCQPAQSLQISLHEVVKLHSSSSNCTSTSEVEDCADGSKTSKRTLNTGGSSDFYTTQRSDSSQVMDGAEPRKQHAQGGTTRTRVMGKYVTANQSVEASLSTSNKSLGEILKDFMGGLKLLWSEIILARKMAAQKKAGHPLTFQEQRLLREVRCAPRLSTGGHTTALMPLLPGPLHEDPVRIPRNDSFKSIHFNPSMVS